MLSPPADRHDLCLGNACSSRGATRDLTRPRSRGADALRRRVRDVGERRRGGPRGCSSGLAGGFHTGSFPGRSGTVPPAGQPPRHRPVDDSLRSVPHLPPKHLATRRLAQRNSSPVSAANAARAGASARICRREHCSARCLLFGTVTSRPRTARSSGRCAQRLLTASRRRWCPPWRS